jgi:hypothetical protein
MRPLADVERDIRNHLRTSSADFRLRFCEQNQVWIIKYIPARFLRNFEKSRSLAISATPGFTWGDGVYVAPLSFPYSTMMYGRAGIMGRLPWDDTRTAWDATAIGVDIYLEWIQYFRGPYRWGATTLHADLANRVLRNAFRRKFGIDIVFFPPDQFNKAYVDLTVDRWFVVSDWSSVGPQAPGQTPKSSSMIQDCEWVAIVEEEFQQSVWKTHYTELFRPALHGRAIMTQNATLVVDLKNAYAQRRTGTPALVRIEA